MKNKKTADPAVTASRKARALRARGGSRDPVRDDVTIGPQGDAASLALLHDLEAYQIELELQNEELRQAQLHLAQSRNRLSELYEFAPFGYATLDAALVIREINLAGADVLGQPRKKLLGESFAAFLDPPTLVVFRAFLQEALDNRGRTRIEIPLCRGDHTLVQIRVESTVIHGGSMPPGLINLALIDITQSANDQLRLHESNQRLEAAVSERTAALSASVEELRSQEQRLGLALDAGAMGTWTVDVARGRCTCDERHERLYARERRPGGYSLEEWRAYLYADDRERMSALLDRALQGLETVVSAEYRIVWPDRSVHWLMLRGRVLFDARGMPEAITGVEQDIDERKLLEMEVLRVAGDERQHIGMELHDDVQQHLTGLGLLADSLREVSERLASPLTAMCTRLARGIADVSVNVHRLSHGLVPLDLDGEGLSIALGRLARSIDAPGTLRCTLQIDEGLDIQDPFAASHLYRIAQEAVSNAVRHSGASRITLSLKQAAGRTSMVVADNGCGIARRHGEGRGFRIMSYRASLVGATFEVEKARGRGTRVRCTWPSVDPVVHADSGGGDDARTG